MKWTEKNIPDQTGRLVVVTGANSGIGYEAARVLAHKGARVILACRSVENGEAAVKQIRSESPTGKVEFAKLDLGSLASVEAFAKKFNKEYKKLDLLVCNAGVMMPPGKVTTSDGFELQFGTNHLGHFALAGRVLPAVLAAKGSRVVLVSSGAHHMGKIDFEDLNWDRRPFSRFKSYGQSKLANLLFMYELQRRLLKSGSGTIAAAAHPGWTATNLQRHVGAAQLLNYVFAMSAAKGALPTLLAATDPGVKGGDYYGPDGWYELRGFPKKVKSSRAARDEAVAARLWLVSEELTRVRYLD